jgi:hypothetical protein
MSATYRKFWRRSIVFSAVIALVLGLAAYFVVLREPEAAATSPDWPAMTLIYRAEGKTHGLTGEATTQVWKLVYQDAWHWQKTLQQDSANPANVGTTMGLQGTIYTSYSAVTKDTFTKEYPESGGSLLPEQWLSPGREQMLPTKGYVKAASDSLHVTYAKTESVPCQDDPGNALTGVVQPTICATAPSYNTRETIVYQVDHNLPVEIEVVSEQIMIRHLVVTGISFP